jgi:hypothetical protein
MKLPILVEDQTKLPEGFTDHYVEQENGSFLLDVEGVDNHPDVHGLKTSLQKQKTDREKLRTERDSLLTYSKLIPEGMTTDELQKALEKFKAGSGDGDGDGKGDGDGGDDASAKLNLLRETLEKKFQKELGERDTTITKKESTIRRLVVETALSSALTKNKVTNPAFQKAAKTLLAPNVKISENDKGDFVGMVDTDMGEVTVEQYVKDWANGDEGFSFVEGNTGSGAPGSKNRSGKKELTRTQFDELGPAQRAEFTKNGGRIFD